MADDDQQHGQGRGIRKILLVIVANVVAFNVLFQLYKMVRRTFVQRGEALGFDHAEQIIRIEKALHAYFELDIQRWGLRHEWLMTFFSYYYSTFMWLFYACCAVGIIFAPAKYRYMRRVFICSMLIALPWYAIYPLAPPRFMTGEGFVDAKLLFGPTPVSERGIVAANLYAAMPSMHVGWSTIGAAILAVSLPHWRIGIILGALHVFLMSTTVIITGNHWWLDIVGGWLVVTAAFLAARLLPEELPRPWRRRAAPTPDLDSDPRPSHPATESSFGGPAVT